MILSESTMRDFSGWQVRDACIDRLERHLTKMIRSLHRKWINPSKSLAKASEVGDFRISDVCIWFVMGSVWTGLQMALRRVQEVQLVLLGVDMSRLC